MSGILMLLLLVACSKSSSEGGGEEPEIKKPVLRIYIFPPNRPIVTRADDLGNVDATEEENKINSLHVWVFERDESNLGNSKLVGHVSLGTLTLSEAGTGEVTMEITDEFAQELMTSNPRPRVDVYVAANVTSTNCGLSFSALTKNGETTESQVDALLIGSNYFGVTSPITRVPSDGLPMSGVLKNLQVHGNSPVFRVVDSSGNLANVQLVRAVSKMRFIFCKSTTNEDEVDVKNIILNKDVLPEEEYLFLEDDYKKAAQKWRIMDSYVNEAKTLVSIPSGTAIKANESPSSYSYDGTMNGQDYENLINAGVTQEKLSDLGTFYLRESDLALTGKIDYKIVHTENGTTTTTEKTTSYSMSIPGDFSRNHTWIVYGYFITSGDLEMNIVEMKNWDSGEISGNVYNW